MVTYEEHLMRNIRGEQSDMVLCNGHLKRTDGHGSL